MTGEKNLTAAEIVRENLLTAQTAVLGSALIDAKAAPEVFRRAKEEYFTNAQRDLFSILKGLFQNRKPLDPVVAAGKMRERGYEKTDAQRLILGIMDVTPTAANVGKYLSMLENNAALERVQEIGVQLAGVVEVDAARAMAEELAGALCRKSDTRTVSAKAGFVRFVDALEETPKLIPWGFPRLNNVVMTRRGDFVVIGARPSVGKTAMGLQMAWEQSKSYKVGFFSLETSAEEIYFRLVSNVAGVDGGDIRRRALTDSQYESITKAAKEFDYHRLDVIEASAMTVDDIRALTVAEGYDVIFVDYLQIVNQKGVSRYEKVTEISNGLHRMAVTLGVLVVGLSQLSRPERGGDKPPTLQDLRESGQIEQDAECVLLMHRNADDTRTVQVAKNKKGRAGGYIDLGFRGDIQLFYEK